MNKSSTSNFLPYNTMTLTGKGQISVAPDVATVRLGVETTGQNLATIQADNARISQTIIQALRQFGINDIKTIQYAIDKQYRYENDKRIDNGYSVRNILEVRVSDIAQVGMIIDTAVQNGANVIDFVTFEVSNAEFYYQQALNMAVANAIQKAKSIAAQLRAPLDPVPRTIVENSTAPIPYTAVFSTRERSAVTPIEPGQYQIDASVTAEFAYYFSNYSSMI